MIVNESDLDAYLAHYGVKGMKWGRTKKVLKVAAIGGAVVGGAAALYVLNKNGHLNAADLIKHKDKIMKGKAMLDTFKQEMPAKNGVKQKPVMQQDVAKAKAAAADHAAYKKQVNDVLADMKDANKSQDAWMRSMGLGAAVNQDKKGGSQ